MLTVALAALLALPATAPAETFVVNDLGDFVPEGNGCGSDLEVEECTLRDAILSANEDEEASAIEFAVAGTISIGNELPAIVQHPVALDATTAPGYVDAPVVELDGSGPSLPRWGSSSKETEPRSKGWRSTASTSPASKSKEKATPSVGTTSEPT